MSTDSPTRILEMLRTEGDYLSGERICDELGVTRAAVWKHIRRLREWGYEIASRTNRGYCLTGVPNTPLPTEVLPLLRTHSLGRVYHYLDETDSTNRVAAELAARGAPAGTTVVANAQTAGRGRLQRTWYSPPDVNLYLSVVLRPMVHPVRVPQLALVTGLALVRTVRRMCPDAELGLKWPNDVFAGGKKLAGILCEMDADMDAVRHVIVGVGINANLEGDNVPPDVSGRAASLSQCSGQEIGRAALLAAFLGDLEDLSGMWIRDGLAPLTDEWLEYSILKGRRVRLVTLREEVEGTAVGLAPTGALRLQHDDGSIQDVLSGDVHVADY